ncbi:MAG: hypothetical protein QME61_00570 [Patescibacteria group bacterium]|nr:hypothetical protein [Patescibacteria group bacterium]
MTLFWIIVAIVLIGLVIWYLKGRKKGPAVPEKPAAPSSPSTPPSPPETPGM